jgi:hypothetical protein
MTADRLEILIESWRLVGTHEPDKELQREAFKRMGELIAQRSPAQIERMERAQGLRA